VVPVPVNVTLCSVASIRIGVSRSVYQHTTDPTLTLRVLSAGAYPGHTPTGHHQHGEIARRETLTATPALHCLTASHCLTVVVTDWRCETHPMATETRFRDPAAPEQAIPFVGVDDDTRAAEGWAPPSWEQVVRDHADRVYRLAYRLSGNPHDAEDLTQETFIRVFRSLGSYKPGTFEGWLHRITTNLFLDMVRRRSRLRMEGLPEDTDRLIGGGPSPEQVYAETHLDPDLQEALDDLAPEFRAAVVLCDVEGLSYEEIGATLGVKLGTVRSRIHRGRQALRVALERRRALAEREAG
jgi:RNA polymerase sigma factor (sigma-70 family)